MRFRSALLFILLLSQPLAAFNQNCSMAATGSAVADEPCATHMAHDQGATHAHDPAPDSHPSTGHAVNGAHCQLCASGAFLLPLATMSQPLSLFTAVPLPAAARVPQFHSGPLFRPPIR